MPRTKEIYRRQRVEATNNAECQRKANSGTRHMIPQNEEKFPEPDKINGNAKIREICSLANEQCNARWKNTKNLRKYNKKTLERFRTSCNEKLKQRRKLSPTHIKDVKRTLINAIKRNKYENFIKTRKIPMTEAEVVESAF